MPRRAVAFETFYDAHFSSVCRSLTVALRDPLLAEDAAQEAFTRAYVSWRRVARMEHPAAWVYVVAVRVAFKRRAARGAMTMGSQTFDIAEAVVDRETLRAAIETLPERQRLAVVLRYDADLPLADIAAAMGCAVGTVKSTLHAALARLEVHLTDDAEVRDMEGRDMEVRRDARG